MFTVTEDQIRSQLAEATATDESGDHLVRLYQGQFILSEEGPRSLQQASAWLSEGEWVDEVVTTCGLDECLRPDHILSQAAAKDAADLRLVAQQAVSLADLYRKARSRGLTAPATSY
jgi:hypothetical protein